jgi:hypothetical protein
MLYSKLLAMGQSHADIVKRLRTTDQVLVRLYEATHRFLHMTINTVDNTPPQDKIYRVEITNNAVEVVCLGLDSVDSDANAYYDSMESLPKWAKDKLYVLSMFKCGGVMPIVGGVGRRISENVFWLFVE